MPETTVDSFILRFVQVSAELSSTSASWHGVIRHVQSNQEIRFKYLQEALEFVGNFVDLDVELPPIQGIE